MYKMCLSLSEKMIKSGRELKADSPSPMCAGNGVCFLLAIPGNREVDLQYPIVALFQHRSKA